MFSVPSLGKILVLVAIIAVVWFGFRLVGRLDRARKEQVRAQAQAPKRRADRARRDIEDTEKCRVCGAYVAARGAAPCGRADCPY